MSRRLTLGTLLVAVLCLLVSVYAVHGNQRSYRAELIDKHPLQLDIGKDVRALCVYKNHNDTGSSVYSSAQSGDAFFTYVDPDLCGLDPTYPFSVDAVQLTLADYTGAVWPVDVSIEVWVGNQDTPCAGPHQMITSEVFTLSEADFAAPVVGRIELTDPVCVGGPFYIAVRYEGSTSAPYPAVVFDGNDPIDSCYNWVQPGGTDNDILEWYDVWAAPVPGDLVIWVEGNTEAGDCADYGPEYYSIPSLHDNYEDLLGTPVTVVGYYTNADDGKMVMDFGEFLADEPMSPKTELFVTGQAPDSAYYLANILAKGYLMAEDDPRPIYPTEDTVTLTLHLYQFEPILDPPPIPTTDVDAALDADTWYPQNKDDCDECKFAMIISGGINDGNNHARYWNNTEKLYRHKVDNENYCDSNMFVLYYDGDSEDTTKVPDDRVDSCTQANIRAAHQTIAQRIANCNRDGKKSRLQKLITNHGAPDGIHLLGNNKLTGDSLREYQQWCIDSCCSLLMDEMVQCYGGTIADSMRSIDDQGKTTVKVNSGAGNVVNYSTPQFAEFLRVKVDSLANGSDYDRAVAAGAERYREFLDSLVNGWEAWFITVRNWLAANPWTFTPQDTVRWRVIQDSLKVRARIDTLDNDGAGSNIWVRHQMKKFCDWKKVVVPKGGQLCLEWDGEPQHCGNVTVYKDTGDGTGATKEKVAIWNWNIPGSAGYDSTHQRRYINADTGQSTTFWIHNDDGEYALTATTRIDTLNDESPSNIEAFAGWSLGGTDGSPEEFGFLVDPFVTLNDVNLPGFTLNQVPALWGPCGTSQLTASHFVPEITPWHQAMQLRIVVAFVEEPAIVNFTISDVEIPNGTFEITEPGEYAFDCGAMFPGSGFQEVQIQVDAGCFAVDSWALRSTVLDAPSCCQGNRGNVDGDQGDAVNISDVTALVAYLFSGGTEPSCLDEADVNADGTVNIADVTYLVAFLFSGGDAPMPCP